MTFDALFKLLAEHGKAQYGGEGVTQLQHALQTAQLAERSGAPPALIAAALLHDIGHLAHALGEDASSRGIDDHHEARAVGLLKPVFPEAVWRPVALHVQAKRWLCAQEPAYAAGLSEESQRSLALQGGPMTLTECAAFETLPFSAQAISLRRWDDLAKDPQAQPPALGHWQAIAAGATSVRPMENQFWGDRMGRVADPFDHQWSLGTHVEDVEPEEMERRFKAMMGG